MPSHTGLYKVMTRDFNFGGGDKINFLHVAPTPTCTTITQQNWKAQNDKKCTLRLQWNSHNDVQNICGQPSILLQQTLVFMNAVVTSNTVRILYGKTCCRGLPFDVQI